MRSGDGRGVAECAWRFRVCELRRTTKATWARAGMSSTLVPYRLTLGNSGNTAETFTVAIAADAMDAGAPGYDVMSAPEINAASSAASGCAVSSGPQTTLSPGIGGIDQTIYRLITGDDSGDTRRACWITTSGSRWGRICSRALRCTRTCSTRTSACRGSVRRIARSRSTRSARRSWTKTMTASQDQDVHWAISKDASPVNVNLNDCLACQDRAAVSITINYTEACAAAEWHDPGDHDDHGHEPGEPARSRST